MAQQQQQEATATPQQFNISDSAPVIATAPIATAPSAPAAAETTAPATATTGKRLQDSSPETKTRQNACIRR